MPPHPRPMIRRKVSLRTQSQLPPHVHITLFVDLALVPHTLDTFLVALPWRPAVHASDRLSSLAACPLLEAGGVDVVAAGGFAEHDGFGGGGHGGEADGAVAFDGFAVGGVGGGGEGGRWRGVGEDLAELLCRG